METTVTKEGLEYYTEKLLVALQNLKLKLKKSYQKRNLN